MRLTLALLLTFVAVACSPDAERSEPARNSDSVADARVPMSDTAAAVFSFQITKDADPLPPIPKPVYPKALRSAEIDGKVEVRFVVDTTGKIEMGSVQVLQSSHRYFTDAVLATLPKMRFLPAEYQGRKVRRALTQPFTFRVVQ